MRVAEWLLALSLIPAAVSASPLDRVSAGILANGTQSVTASGTSLSFVPGAFISASLAENLSASSSYQYYTVDSDSQEVRVGLRLIATGTKPGDRVQLAIGTDLLYLPENGEATPTVSLRGSVGIIKDSGERMDAYVTARVEYAPEWEKKWYSLGVLVPLFGGGPR